MGSLPYATWSDPCNKAIAITSISDIHCLVSQIWHIG
jgi:hypothetical protein